MRLTPLPSRTLPSRTGPTGLPSRFAVVGMALVLSGCSGNGSSAGVRDNAGGPGVPAVVAGQSSTWSDGMVLRGQVTIPAGSTVSLEQGAGIAAAKGSSLTVAGTLLAPRGGRLAGGDWEGITIAAGGTVTLARVDLRGSGLTTQAGARPSSLSGAISEVTTPFDIAAGTSLALTATTVRKVSGAGGVKGTLTASGLSYDKAGNPGIVVSGPASALRVKDSVFYGNGEYDGDMITADEAGELTVSSTEVRDVHCAFHLVGVGRMTLDGLSLHDNAYGFMAYGSDPTQVHRITDTDVFDNRDFGLSETPGTVQGRIIVDGGYWGRNGTSEVATLAQSTGKVERTNPASAPRR